MDKRELDSLGIFYVSIAITDCIEYFMVTFQREKDRDTKNFYDFTCGNILEIPQKIREEMQRIKDSEATI